MELFCGVGEHCGSVRVGDVGSVDLLIVFARDDVTEVAFIGIEVVGITRDLDIHTGIERDRSLLDIVPIVNNAVEDVICDLDVLRRVDGDSVPKLVICELTLIDGDVLDRKCIARCNLAGSCEVDAGSYGVSEVIVDYSGVVEEAAVDIDVASYGAFSPAGLYGDKYTGSAYGSDGAILDVYVGCLHEISS